MEQDHTPEKAFSQYKLKRSAGLHQLHRLGEEAKQLRDHGRRKDGLPALDTEASG